MAAAPQLTGLALLALCCCALATVINVTEKADGSNSSMAFPPEFMIGCASASYQVEGAWNTDGKGENIWDHLVHNHPERIKNKATGDIACNSYHKYKEDVQLIKDIGFYHYRFSISWPRILPTGHDNNINKAGVEYYHRLIDELLLHGIQPMVTIYHWDLPQPLQELGGWANPLMADYFEQYARVLFTEYASKVKWWITINEPFQISRLGYGIGGFAPAVNQSGVADLLATHTLLQAHARVYHLYKSSFQQFSPDKQGQIGISIHAMNFIPLTDSEADRQAVARAKAFEHDIYAHPIFSKDGDYPAIVKERVIQKSKIEGRSASRLPVFTEEEIKLLRGSSDFFGLNHYTSKLITTGVTLPEHYISFTDADVVASIDPSWPTSSSSWLQSVPWGIRSLLKQLKDDYNNTPVLITENGWSSDSSLEDTGRVKYYHDYLEQVLKAKNEDGCNIIGYTAWSILDNFEWLDGYEARFGITYVDFEDPARPRTKKKSAEYFKTLLKTRQLPPL